MKLVYFTISFLVRISKSKWMVTATFLSLDFLFMPFGKFLSARVDYHEFMWKCVVFFNQKSVFNRFVSLCLFFSRWKIPFVTLYLINTVIKIVIWFGVILWALLFTKAEIRYLKILKYDNGNCSREGKTRER